MSTIATRLPIEVVHIICEYTGKFHRIGPKLMSMIDTGDYENIKIAMAKNAKNSFAFFLNKERLVMRLSRMKNGSRSEEERKQDHIQHFQNVDYKRHPLLFDKECPADEVFKPDTYETCAPCAVRLFLSKKRTFHINEPKEGQCVNCMRYIKHHTESIRTPIRTQQTRQIDQHPRQPFYSRGRIRSSSARKN